MSGCDCRERIEELERALWTACDMIEYAGKAYVDYDPAKLEELERIAGKVS